VLATISPELTISQDQKVGLSWDVVA